MPIPVNIGGRQWAEQNVGPYEETSTNIENFQAGLGQMVDEELSISKYIGNQNRRDRNTMVQDMVKEGKISEEAFDQFSAIQPRRGRRTDWDGLSNYVNENLGLEDHIPNDEELTKERDDILANKRQYREDITKRSDASGKWSSFGGTIIGSVADPINVATMFASAPLLGVKQTSRALYTMSTMGRTALLEATVATAVEPFVHSYKEELGVEYGWQDSAMNVLAAGVLGGSISGVAANIGHRVSTSRFDNALTQQRDALITSFRSRGIEEGKASTMADVVMDNPTASVDELDEIAEEVLNSKLNDEEKAAVEETKNVDNAEVEAANKVDSNNSEEYARNLEETTALDEREADAIAMTLRESNEAPDPDMPATEHIDRLETTADELDNNKSVFSRLADTDLDPDDPEGIERIFQEEIGDDDFEFVDPESGERMRLSDMDKEYDDLIEEYNDIANCLNGEI